MQQIKHRAFANPPGDSVEMSAQSAQSPPPESAKRQADTESPASLPPLCIASPKRNRRASSPSGQPILRDSSPFASRKSDGPNVHSFTEGKKLKYLKASQNGENTPIKARRNASLPEELADLAEDAQQENIEDESEIWAEYRKVDLAPMEEVMQDGLAGDLIMLGSLTGRGTSGDAEDNALYWTFEAREGGDLSGEATGNLSDRTEENPLASYLTEDIKDEPEKEDTVYELDIPGHFLDFFKIRVRTKGCPEDVVSFIQKRGEELEASQEDVDKCIQVILSEHRLILAAMLIQVRSHSCRPQKDSSFQIMMTRYPQTKSKQQAMIH